MQSSVEAEAAGELYIAVSVDGEALSPPFPVVLRHQSMKPVEMKRSSPEQPVLSRGFRDAELGND